MVVDFVPNGLTNFIYEIDSIMPILRHIKVNKRKIFLKIRKYFHIIGPRKSNFISKLSYSDVSLEASLNCLQESTENLELLRALGPLIIADVSISEFSSSSFTLLIEPSLEAANIMIPVPTSPSGRHVSAKKPSSKLTS